MRAVLQIALGIIAAVGGFMEIGDLVFSSQAGATFGYATLWGIPIGVGGIILFSEMSGRVSAVAKKPTFQLVRERYGERLSLFTLVSSLVLTVLTLAAELGGLGFVLNYFFDVSVGFFVLVALIAIAVAIYFLPFEGIERLFGYMGLALLVYIASSINLDPDWGEVGRGFVPESHSAAVYWYFVVGLIAAALMPYEIYFYSSGAVEERWGPRDMTVNRLNAIVGFGLGGLISVGILVTAAQLFKPAGISPTSIGSVGLMAEQPYAELGLILALVGILFAVGGATIDTAFSAAYNLAQHQGWKWGKRRGLENEPRFTISLLAFLLIGLAVAQTGIDPIQLTEYAVIFSVIILPLTYLPILLVAHDRGAMGEHVNKRFDSAIGVIGFVLIVAIALAAVPLMYLSRMGQA